MYPCATHSERPRARYDSQQYAVHASATVPRHAGREWPEGSLLSVLLHVTLVGGQLSTSRESCLPCALPCADYEATPALPKDCTDCTVVVRRSRTDKHRLPDDSLLRTISLVKVFNLGTPQS